MARHKTTNLSQFTLRQQADIAELRRETAELRLANASLERQIRDGLQVCLVYDPL